AALAYARAALELSRREEDPRYLGYAEAALARWRQRPQPPPEVMLLRASLRLARVDYDSAERDLRALIESPAPEGHAARITRASLYVSKGEPAAALADCEAATAYVSPLVGSTCVAAARGLASAADEHARRLALRFQEMRERGDRSHLREQALFELVIRRDAARALQLIRQSWAFLREPVDARLYLRAAIAAKEPTAALPVQDWLRKSGLQDARLTPELAAAQKLATSP